MMILCFQPFAIKESMKCPELRNVYMLTFSLHNSLAKFKWYQSLSVTPAEQAFSLKKEQCKLNRLNITVCPLSLDSNLAILNQNVLEIQKGIECLIELIKYK